MDQHMILTLEKMMKKMVKNELRLFELQTELKNKSREDKATRTIQDLYGRIAELEAKVNTLDPNTQFASVHSNGIDRNPSSGDFFAKYEKLFQEKLIPLPVRDPNQLTRDIKFVPESVRNQLLQEARTYGTTSLEQGTSLDEMERRTQRMKKALNMEGSQLGMNSNGEYYVYE